jgi:hypothetical protein
MTKIQKVVREIENLRDFYKRTKSLRDRIKKKNVVSKSSTQGKEQEIKRTVL